MDSIDIMKKCISSLCLEVPEPVIEDVEKKWSRVEFYISWLKYQINEYGSHKADCEIYQAKNECCCGYEQQETDLIMSHNKEIELRDGIMNRQKEALRLKDKEIERLKKERDFWKASLLTELIENESGDGVNNEMYEYERELQQALKEKP